MNKPNQTQKKIENQKSENQKIKKIKKIKKSKKSKNQKIQFITVLEQRPEKNPKCTSMLNLPDSFSTQRLRKWVTALIFASQLNPQSPSKDER
jgi:hypothetical protein